MGTAGRQDRVVDTTCGATEEFAVLGLHQLNKPPSSDSSFRKKSDKKRHGKAGVKRGHPKHRQQILESTKVMDLKPERCLCGHGECRESTPFHTHKESSFR
jgi:hypothetical protein